MMRTDSCVRLVASVCARIIASPRRISTSDGGMTTPSVLATHTSAALSSSLTPDASRRGCTVRESMATLAPTAPFIGASRTPSPRPVSNGPAPVPASARLPVRKRISASGRRLSSVPISTYRGSACRMSCSSRPKRRDGIAVSSGKANTPAIMPPPANASATPSRTCHAGSPVAMSSAPTATSIAMPMVSLMLRAGRDLR